MRPIKMPVRHVSPHPQSLSDPVARLFECDGQLLRGIMPEHELFYERLLASPALDRLFAAGLVKTERADVMLEGYPLALEHQRVDFVSDWREWPSLMLRDAAAMVCELCFELAGEDYGMLDIHPWNVLYDFSRPVFVDFSSIVPLERAWLDEQAGRFRDYWILPLTFISMGHPHLARSIRKSCEVTEPLDEFLKRPLVRWFPFWYQRLRRRAPHEPSEFFRKLKIRLESLRLPVEDLESPHEVEDDATFEAVTQQDARARVVSALLERLKPETLLDVGSGSGRYSMLAERQGIKVVAIDLQEARVNSLYRHTKSRGLKILPLLLDFSIPTTGQGRRKEFPPSTNRLTCDATLLLSILDQLVFELHLSFERIADLLSAYSRRHAIVEFMPPRDAFVFKHNGSRFAWYGMENFVKAMERHFRLSEVLELETPRKLLLFEKY